MHRDKSITDSITAGTGSVRADTPVFMVGIDGAEWTFMQPLLAEGKLPTLVALMQQGCHGKLASPADEYAGGVWPDFYTGKPVAQHGIYHNKLWRQQNMRCEVPTDHWLPSRPFYEALSDQGYRVCVLDMPMVLGAPRSLNGIYLGGWGTHDLIAKGATPPGLWQRLCSGYGVPLMPAEHFGRQSAHSLLALRDQLVAATEQMADIGVDLLGSECWDFACVILGSTHRAGHYMWDDSQLENASDEERQAISTALESVYIACDKALEKLLSVAPENALKVVFAVHGMQPNHGWGDMGSELLEAILQASRQQKPKRGLLYEVKRRIPYHLVRPLLSRLPPSVTDRLVQLWSANMYDWQATPYFPLPMDQAGYIRINLRGREKKGIVDPGADYRDTCDELERYLLSLRDADSGHAIIDRVIRAWQESPADAEARDVLPDLVLVWAEHSTKHSRCVVSELLPGFTVRVPEHNASGRSGNHVGCGWFVATGENLVNDGRVDGYTIRDLAPAVFDIMGARPLADFENRVSLWQVKETNDH